MNNTNTTLEKAVILLNETIIIFEEVTQEKISETAFKKIEKLHHELKKFSAVYNKWKQEREQKARLNIYTIESLFDVDQDYCGEEVIKISDLSDQQMQLLGISHN